MPKKRDKKSVIKKVSLHAKRVQGATVEQCAEIKRLESAIQSDIVRANRPYVILATIFSTTLTFSFLVLREDAPLHKLYLNLLKSLFSNYVSSAFKGYEKVAQNKAGEFFASVRKSCLDYYTAAIKCRSQIPLAQNEQSALIQGVSLETCLGTVLKPDAINVVRNSCIYACKQFMHGAELSSSKVIDMTGQTARFDSLSLDQLFHSTDVLHSHAKDFYAHDVPVTMSRLADLNTEIMAEERKNIIISLVKIPVIWLSQKYIISPILNRFFPKSTISMKKPVLSNSNFLMKKSQAEGHIRKKRKFALYARRVANRNDNLITVFFVGAALFYLLFFSISGSSSVSGEFAFVILCVAATGLYNVSRYIKNRVNNHFLEKKLSTMKRLLESKLNQYFKVSLIQGGESKHAQFIFRCNNRLTMTKSKDLIIIFSRCLSAYNIPIVSEGKENIVIGFNSRINEKILSDIGGKLKSGLERLLKINAAHNKIRKDYRSLTLHKKNGRFYCNKTYDKHGYLSVTWHVCFSDKKTALLLMKCFDGGAKLNKSSDQAGCVVTIVDTVIFSAFKLSIELRKEVEKNGGISSDEYFPSEPPLHKRTKQKRPRAKETHKGDSESKLTEPVTKRLNTETSETPSLPTPYGGARKIRAPFLSKNKSHLWALFSAPKGDFPTGECYIKFESLFAAPAVVPPKKAQGLVYDKKRSRPGHPRYKAKVLGTYGAYRVLAHAPRQLQGETIYIFSELILAHS